MRPILQSLVGLWPVFLMLAVQVMYTAVTILYKIVDSQGMNLRILVAYRWALAVLFTTPLAVFMERNSVRPNLTWRILGLAFLSGLFGGTLSQNLFLECLRVTSATFVVAIFNLSPGITLILSVCLRYENLRLSTRAGKAKALGILIAVGGAMIMTFYRGVKINIWSTNVNLLKTHTLHHTSTNYVLGFLYGIGSCACMSLWFIIQAEITKVYPLDYTNASMTSLMAAIQCVIFSVCIERNWDEWKLEWNIKLVTVVYAGTVNSGLLLIFVAWCVRARGPVFVSSFNPLSLVLHLGSVLGALLIICGLYLFIWGQHLELKEKENRNQNPNENEIREDDLELIHIEPAGSSAAQMRL